MHDKKKKSSSAKAPGVLPPRRRSLAFFKPTIKPKAERILEKKEEKPQAKKANPAVRKRIPATAGQCPLVADGEIDRLLFTSDACIGCGEFDCPFNVPSESSGDLRSRTFAPENEDAPTDDGWGNPIEPDSGENSGDD